MFLADSIPLDRWRPSEKNPVAHLCASRKGICTTTLDLCPHYSLPGMLLASPRTHPHIWMLPSFCPSFQPHAALREARGAAPSDASWPLSDLWNLLLWASLPEGAGCLTPVGAPQGQLLGSSQQEQGSTPSGSSQRLTCC